MTATGFPALVKSSFRIGDLRLWRYLLWLPVIALTVALLTYPRTMTLEFSPIQSLEAVAPLTQFAILYYSWMIALVALLLLQGQDRASHWQGLALVGTFVLVYRGFWDIPFAAVKHVDSVLNTTTVDYIRVTGTVPFGHPNITYADFPGLHILTVALATTIGVATEDAVTVILLAMDVLLAGVLYLICLHLLKDTRWAGIACLLAMQGSIVFAHLVFYPGTLGLVFASMLLLLALNPNGAPFDRPSYAVLALILLAAITITHFVTSALVLSFLVGTWLVRHVRSGPKEPFPSSRVALYVVVPLAWLVYAAVQTFGSLVGVSDEISGNLLREGFLRDVFVVGGSNLGPALPLWVTALRLFWLVFLYGAGTVAALLGLRRLRSLPSVEATALGALLGIFLLAGTATLISSGGSQFLRYLMYAPLVVAPLLLMTVGRLTLALRRVGLAVVVVSLVALAVPTFLANYATVQMDTFYAYEEAPAQMLGRHATSTSALLFGPAGSYAPYIRYLPDAQYVPVPEFAALKNDTGVWGYLENDLNDFTAGRNEGVSIYIYSTRPRATYWHNFGIPLDDPSWDAIRSHLEGQAAIYDNGFVTLYEATSPKATNP